MDTVAGDVVIGITESVDFQFTGIAGTGIDLADGDAAMKALFQASLDGDTQGLKVISMGSVTMPCLAIFPNIENI